MSGETKIEKLELKEVVRKAKPDLADKLPKFVYRYLNRILHVDELNGLLELTADDTPQEFLEHTVKFFDFKLEFVGFEKLDKLKESGEKVIFAANHPIGGPEGIALMSRLLPLYPDVKIMVQSYLSIVQPLRPIAVYNKGMLATAYRSFKNGDPMMIFPAGFCSRRLSTGEVFDLDWRDTFVKLARRFKRTIVPIHISGSLSKRMNRWYRFRQIFGIKTTIETIFLVDEMFKFRGKTLTFTCGDPIPWDALDKDAEIHENSLRVRQYIHDLKDDPSAAFDPQKPNTIPVL